MDSIAVQFNPNPSNKSSISHQSNSLDIGSMSANAAELSATLSLLRPPLATTFSQIPAFAFSDPSTLLMLTQHLQNAQNFSSLPLASLTSTTSNMSNQSLKKSINDIQPPASPQSSSSSSAISSSPQPSPQRKHAAPVPDEKKDEAYYERRRKNNDAAKRSRDARRQKEELIAAKATFLEQENIRLRSQIELLKNEIATLRVMLISSHTTNFDKTKTKVEQ